MMWDSLRNMLPSHNNIYKSPMEDPATDDKRLMASASDANSQVSAPDEKQHTMSEHRTRRGSRTPSKTTKSSSTSSKSWPENPERHPSFPLSEEPMPIDQSLYEQLEEKTRLCKKLEFTNQALKADLLKHLSDPYAKHKCSDGEIQRHYEQLLHRVEQTARRLCESMGHDVEALVEVIDMTKTQEGINQSEQLDFAIALLQRKYRGKFFQKSVAEMILFRALLRFALPPRILSTGLTQEENRASKALLDAMRERATILNEGVLTTDTERLSQLEKWRLDTVLYVIQHESASVNIDDNKIKMLKVLIATFERAGESTTMLKEFIDAGFEFAQLLQKQKSIYYFFEVKDEFNAEYMDFQDPRQAECLGESNELEPEQVKICFYPAFGKMASSETSRTETSRIIMAKGKALYSPWEYN